MSPTCSADDAFTLVIRFTAIGAAAVVGTYYSAVLVVLCSAFYIILAFPHLLLFPKAMVAVVTASIGSVGVFPLLLVGIEIVGLGEQRTVRFRALGASGRIPILFSRIPIVLYAVIVADLANEMPVFVKDVPIGIVCILILCKRHKSLCIRSGQCLHRCRRIHELLVIIHISIGILIDRMLSVFAKFAIYIPVRRMVDTEV